MKDWCPEYTNNTQISAITNNKSGDIILIDVIKRYMNGIKRYRTSLVFRKIKIKTIMHCEGPKT